MKKITLAIVAIALVGLLIGAYYQTTQTIGNSTNVNERQSLEEVLEESLGDAYSPHLVDEEAAP